jgi:hypothetical protein
MEADFTHLSIDNDLTDPSDWLKLRFPFSGRRERFDVYRGDTEFTAKPSLVPASDRYGDFRFDNITEKVFEVLVKGEESTNPLYGKDARSSLFSAMGLIENRKNCLQ